MKLRLVIFVLLALTAVSTALGDDAIGAVAIVTGRKASNAGLTMDQLVAVFKCNGKTQPQFVMRESGSPERSAILRSVYKMTETEYRRFFLQATFTGAISSAPKQFRGPESVKKYLNDNDGTIGYLALADVDDTVQVIRIDGRSPSDPNYAIK